MKTNTFFYTLLIALFSLTFVSCDENDDLTVIDEMSKLENDSISRRVNYRFEIDGENLIDSTGIKSSKVIYKCDSLGDPILEIEYRFEIDGEDLIDSTGLYVEKKE